MPPAPVAVSSSISYMPPSMRMPSPPLSTTLTVPMVLRNGSYGLTAWTRAAATSASEFPNSRVGVSPLLRHDGLRCAAVLSRLVVQEKRARQ